MHKKYELRSCVGGERIQVIASDEAEARRLAMIQRWGIEPDALVPNAPDYRGLGLIVDIVPEQNAADEAA